MENELDYIKEKANRIAKGKQIQVSHEVAVEDVRRFLRELKRAIEGGMDVDLLEKQIESFALQDPSVPLIPVPVRYNNLYEIMGFWSRIEVSHRTDLTIRDDGRAWFSDYEMSTMSPPNEESDFRGPSRLIFEEDKQYLQFSGRRIEILNLDLQRKRMWIRLDPNEEMIELNNFSPVSPQIWPCQGIL